MNYQINHKQYDLLAAAASLVERSGEELRQLAPELAEELYGAVTSYCTAVKKLSGTVDEAEGILHRHAAEQGTDGQRTPNPFDAGTFYAKADDIAAFLDEHTEQIDFATYDNFREMESGLRSLGEFLLASDRHQFLAGQLASADVYLNATTRDLAARS